MNTGKKQGECKTIQQELFQFMATSGTPGIMPTVDELLAFGHSRLCTSIQKQGGFSRVARQLGLVYRAKNRGYWSDFSNVKQELDDFIAAYGTPDFMPSAGQLQRAGYYNLVVAINEHGGFCNVARKLGLQYHDKNKADLNTVKQELTDFIAKHGHGKSETMPSAGQLQRAGYHHLVATINELGGFSVTAHKLGLKPRFRGRNYWNNLDNVRQELTTFMAQHSTPGIMPTAGQLQAAGCYSLVVAINKHGGFAMVAQKLGLQR